MSISRKKAVGKETDHYPFEKTDEEEAESKKEIQRFETWAVQVSSPRRGGAKQNWYWRERHQKTPIFIQLKNEGIISLVVLPPFVALLAQAISRCSAAGSTADETAAR